jgi:hypothetical protein
MTGLTLAHAVQYLAGNSCSGRDKKDNERQRSVLYITRDKTKVVSWLQRMLAYTDHEQSTDEVETMSNRLVYALRGQSLSNQSESRGIKAYLNRIDIR